MKAESKEEKKETKIEDVVSVVSEGGIELGRGVAKYRVERAKGRSAVRGKGQRSGRGSLPPALELTPRYTHTFRFTCTSTGSFTIQAIQLCGALGGICTTANSLVQTWTSSFRILGLKAWPAPSSSSTSGIYVDWYFSDTDLFPDTSKSTTVPEGVSVTDAVSFRPPSKSTAGFWVNSTATSSFTLFNISVVAGSVLDLTVQATLPVVNSTTSSLYGLSVTTGTLGNVYYLSLDGPSSNKLPPVSGVPTTH